MKGYRFYAEMPQDWKSKSGCKSHKPFTRANLEKTEQCNVVAVLLDERGQLRWQGSTMNMDAIAVPIEYSNGAVALASVSRDYLRKRCVRIDAALAKKLHPQMFNLLERPE
jgi:hypothetical protein